MLTFVYIEGNNMAFHWYATDEILHLHWYQDIIHNTFPLTISVFLVAMQQPIVGTFNSVENMKYELNSSNSGNHKRFDSSWIWVWYIVKLIDLSHHEILY